MSFVLPPPKKQVYSKAMQYLLFLVPLLAGLVACAQGGQLDFLGWGSGLSKGVNRPVLRLRSGLLAGAKSVPASTRRGILGLSLTMVWC